MLLDDITEIDETPMSLSVFGKILTFIELVILLTLCISFFKARETLAEVVIVSFFAFFILYIFFPTFIFGSKTVRGHLFAHFAGLSLFSCIIGLLFKIESLPHASMIMIFSTLPMCALLINLLLSNTENQNKIRFYGRIGLRFAFTLVLLYYFF